MTTPAWINQAIREIEKTYFPGQSFRPDLPDKFAAIIAARAPQPKPFEWKRWTGGLWYAETPFGEYRACDDRWSFDGYSDNADNLEAAKAAAFADYCGKLDMWHKAGVE